MNKPVKAPHFLIADDHPAIRMVLLHIIKKINPSYTIDEISTVAELSEALKMHHYDMAILDINLEDGITHVELPLMKLLQPDMRILFFSTCPDDIFAQRLIQKGADGFLNKKAKEPEIIEAITKVLNGRRYLSPDFLYALLLDNEGNHKGKNEPFKKLTEREFEVLTLMLKGHTNREISELISLTSSTISSHKARIFEKLEVSSDIELAQLASSSGINYM